MGVPGTENNYAKGWKMGFQVITTYPIAWLVNFAAFGILRNRVGDNNLPRLETVSASIAIALLVIAFARLIWSFKTME